MQGNGTPKAPRDLTPEQKVLFDAAVVGLTRGQGEFTEEQAHQAFAVLNDYYIGAMFLVVLLEEEVGCRLREDGELSFKGGPLISPENEAKANSLSKVLGLEARLEEFRERLDAESP